MNRRGFTLIELMVVIVMLPATIAAVGLFYVETRVAAARIEAQVSMTRSMSIAHEQLARDLRAAESIDVEPQLRIRTAAGVVTYEATPRGLLRRADGRERVLARRVRGLSVSDADVGYTVELRAERKLLRGRHVRMNRTMFVARRR